MLSELERSSQVCPLCRAFGTVWFHEDQLRQYYRCLVCQLVFVPARFFLTPAREKACYDLHQNNPDDPGYRNFLNRLAQPLIEQLEPGARGLDFGCGPGPTLSIMLAEAGFPTAIYDPFYAPNSEIWQTSYDFITATEVVEHLHHPELVLQRLWEVLRPGGWLGIMTKRVLDNTAFANWHYKNDPTHVIFFSVGTFEWLANKWSAELRILRADVVLLKKSVLP